MHRHISEPNLNDINKNQNVQVLNYDFEPYEDIILCTGRKKSGKSTLAKNLSLSFNRVIIWDYNHEHKGVKAAFGLFSWGNTKNNPIIVHNLNDLKTAWTMYSLTDARRIIYQPLDKSPESFNQFCMFINRHVVYCCIYIEELQNVTTASKIPEQWSILVDTGRHRKVGLLITTRNVKRIPTTLIDNADYIFMFKQQRVETYDYMKEYIEPSKVDALMESPLYYYILYDGKNTGDSYLMSPIKIEQNI